MRPDDQSLTACPVSLVVEPEPRKEGGIPPLLIETIRRGILPQKDENVEE